jgi:integrase
MRMSVRPRRPDRPGDTQRAKSRAIESANLHAVAGVAGFSLPPTLDKTISDRKHLVSAKVDKLRAAVKGVRHEARDRCLLLLMFRHGLRVSAACRLLLSQVDIASCILHVKRLKDGLSTTHPL